MKLHQWPNFAIELPSTRNTKKDHDGVYKPLLQN